MFSEGKIILTLAIGTIQLVLIIVKQIKIVAYKIFLNKNITLLNTNLNIILIFLI